MKKLTFLLAFSLIIFYGCEKENTGDFEQSTSTVDATQKKSNPKARPLKGQIVYVEDHEIELTCDCAEPSFIGDYFSGTGNFTHLGKTYSESIPCITYIFCDGCPEEPDYIIGYSVSSQCGTMIAANGDELWHEIEPYTMMLDFDCFCQFAGTATVNITGGTGRFENATGSASVYVVQDLVADNTTATWDGEITY